MDQSYQCHALSTHDLIWVTNKIPPPSGQTSQLLMSCSWFRHQEEQCRAAINSKRVSVVIQVICFTDLPTFVFSIKYIFFKVYSTVQPQLSPAGDQKIIIATCVPSNSKKLFVAKLWKDCKLYFRPCTVAKLKFPTATYSTTGTRRKKHAMIKHVRRHVHE